MIRLMVVRFDAPLSPSETPCLRGALLHAAGADEVLFHDHVGDQLRYAYPLIHYRSADNQAVVACVNEGIEPVKQLLQYAPLDVRIGRHDETLWVAHVIETESLLGLTVDSHTYVVRRYLPLNQDNYERYKATESVVVRYALVERCLIGNILSFAKSMGVIFDDEVQVVILDVAETRTYRYKNVNMMGFDLTFKANVALPDGIALGKGVSLGFGVITLKQ